MEAELDAQLLQEANIPVLLKGPPTGVFGPGFAGATAYGVRLFVPASLEQDARDVLDRDDHSEPNDAA